MNTFTALALATDPASEALLDRQPDRKTAPLISDMQSIYQITVILLRFCGKQFLGLGDEVDGHKLLKTLVFNAFVCEFSTSIMNRYFIAIILLEVKPKFTRTTTVSMKASLGPNNIGTSVTWD
ncbi:hypothetical protein MD484_g314, partial [Candolleomyces efflorescens]